MLDSGKREKWRHIMPPEEEQDKTLGKMIRERKELQTTQGLLKSKTEEILSQVKLGPVDSRLAIRPLPCHFLPR